MFRTLSQFPNIVCSDAGRCQLLKTNAI